MLAGGKIGIDATAKRPQDGYPRTWPEPVAVPAAVQNLIARRWAEYGLE